MPAPNEATVVVGALWFYRARAEGCGVLPPDAERELMRASRVENPEARRRAIDRAYITTSRAHPTLFKD